MPHARDRTFLMVHYRAAAAALAGAARGAEPALRDPAQASSMGERVLECAPDRSGGIEGSRERRIQQLRETARQRAALCSLEYRAAAAALASASRRPERAHGSRRGTRSVRRRLASAATLPDGPRTRSGNRTNLVALRGGLGGERRIRQLRETARQRGASLLVECLAAVSLLASALRLPDGFRAEGERGAGSRASAGEPRNVPRARSGNRTNHVARTWELDETRDTRRSRERRARLLRKASQRQAASFLNRAAATCLFVQMLVVGVGTHRPAAAPAVEPVRYSLTPLSPAALGEGPRDHLVPLVSRTSVRRNEQGQLIEVRASDPRSVLVGYCLAGAGRSCQPVELAYAEPPHPRLRFGLFRDFHEIRAIRIRQDPGSGMWVAGEGAQVLVDYQAATLRLSAVRFPVAALRQPT